jgi:hypothetical protein
MSDKLSATGILANLLHGFHFWEYISRVYPAINENSVECALLVQRNLPQNSMTKLKSADKNLIDIAIAAARYNQT